MLRRPARALERINVLLAKRRLAVMDELPARGTREVHGVRAGVLTGRQGRTTALLWVAFFLLMTGFYSAASRTPRLLEQSGLSAQQGIGGGVLLNVGDPTSVRTTAMGWAAAFGRLGAITSPILAGVLVDDGWTGQQLFFLLAGTMLIAAVLMAVLVRGRADNGDLLAAAAVTTIPTPPDEATGPVIPHPEATIGE